MTRRQDLVFGIRNGLKEGFRLILWILLAPFAAMRAFVRDDLPIHHR